MFVGIRRYLWLLVPVVLMLALNVQAIDPHQLARNFAVLDSTMLYAPAPEHHNGAVGDFPPLPGTEHREETKR